MSSVSLWHTLHTFQELPLSLSHLLLMAWLILTLMAEINQNYSVRVHYQPVHRHQSPSSQASFYYSASSSYFYIVSLERCSSAAPTRKGRGDGGLATTVVFTQISWALTPPHNLQAVAHLTDMFHHLLLPLYYTHNSRTGSLDEVILR